MREFTAWWSPRGIQTGGCRCTVLTAHVAVGSGSGGCRCPRPSPPRGAASGRRSQDGRSRSSEAGVGREIRRRKPQLYLRRRTQGRRSRKVVGGRPCTRSMGRPLLLPNETNVRKYSGAVGSVQGSWRRADAPRGPHRWIGRWVGGVREKGPGPGRSQNSLSPKPTCQWGYGPI